MEMTNGRKLSNWAESHELICHFITLYLVSLPPYAPLCWSILSRHIDTRFLVYNIIWAFTYVSIIRDTTIGVLWIWIMCCTYHFVRGRHKQWFPTTDCHRICRWGCFINLRSWYSLKVETLSICSYLTEEIEINLSKIILFIDFHEPDFTVYM